MHKISTSESHPTGPPFLDFVQQQKPASWLFMDRHLPPTIPKLRAGHISCPAYTSGTELQERKNADLYWNSFVFLLGLVPCNPNEAICNQLGTRP
jgi:hypothetical protein